MTHAEFIRAVDDQRIFRAIQAAEERTSAEFRVFVSDREVDDPVEAAERQFARLRMHRTSGRNAVLIFVAPRSRNFAIFADTQAHQKAPAGLWDRLAKELRDRFKKDGYTDGLEHVLTELGQALAGPFPRQADDRNELQDDVAR
ncbi:MAG: TPM domain-containing protein [Tepidisphaeraceae bacterium]